MKRVLVFDINETLLDLGALDPVFARLFGDAAARREWFGQLLQSAFLSTITDVYRDFGALGMTALEMVAARRRVVLTEDQSAAVRAGMRALPPHPDARPALEQLRQNGFRLATLTNSTAEVGEAQLVSAGLRDLFELALSADAVKRLKPAPEPYRMAAEQLGVYPAELRLVAAHAWDVTGAERAGCASAFVARPGQVLDPAGVRPEITDASLLEVAARIIALDR